MALGSGRDVIKASGEGGLELGEPGEGRGARFRKAADGSWVGLDGYYAGEPLVWSGDADGPVSHLDLASFRFTRLPYDPERDVPGGVDDRRLALTFRFQNTARPPPAAAPPFLRVANNSARADLLADIVDIGR